MADAVIVSTARTPIGKAYRGAFNNTHGAALGGHVIEHAVQRAGLDPAEVEDVVLGCALPEGATGHNIARQAAIRAGLPTTVSAMTVNRFCSSGLQAIAIAAQRVVLDGVPVAVAGGVESISLVQNEHFNGYRLHEDWLVEHKPSIYYPMLQTAEIVAARYQVGRDAQDAYALASQQRTAEGQRAGRFDAEIVPVTERAEIRHDEGINGALTAEDLAARKPAFRKGGTVTGGNSSPLNDGAAALLLMSADAVRRAGVTPLARYVGSAAAGVHPDYMGIGPVPAMHKALGRAGWRLDEVDLIEINEAFAAQSVAVMDELKCDPGQVNVNGGAIAIGHPLGCSGARIVTTLLHEMRRRGAGRGAATMCIGVGQGIASLWEAA